MNPSKLVKKCFVLYFFYISTESCILSYQSFLTFLKYLGRKWILLLQIPHDLAVRDIKVDTAAPLVDISEET